MTVLSQIQAFCRRTGIEAPTYVVGNPDLQIIQLLGLANEVVTDLLDRARWSDLTEEALFTTVAGQDQGLISTLAPSGFQYIINETIFDRTQRVPIFGPLNNVEWQQRQALPASGPLAQYRIRKGHLYFDPLPGAGHECAFEYQSTWAVRTAGDVFQPQFTLDTDSLVLPEDLLLYGLRWKWKAEKGLEYGEEFSAYELKVAAYSAGDGTKPTINLAVSGPQFQPAITIPLGNWNGS